MEKREKPFNIHSWDDLRRALATMNPKNKLYRIVREEMERRGRWKRISPHKKSEDQQS